MIFLPVARPMFFVLLVIFEHIHRSTAQVAAYYAISNFQWIRMLARESNYNVLIRSYKNFFIGN